MKGRKPGKSRFRTAFMTAAAVLGIGAASTGIDQMPKHYATDTQKLTTFNIGMEDQYGYNISPADQLWKRTLALRSQEDRARDMVEAAANGDSWRVKALFEHGKVDVAQEGAAALLQASFLGHADVVSALLDGGVSANADNGAALVAAMRNSYNETARLLLDHGADAGAQNNLAFLAAVNKGNLAGVQMLLEQKRMVYIPVRHTAFDNWHNPMSSRYQVGSVFGGTYGDFDFPMPQVMQVRAVNVNANDGQALHMAVRASDARMVQLLLSHGADPDARMGMIHWEAAGKKYTGPQLQALLREHSKSYKDTATGANPLYRNMRFLPPL